MRSVLRFFSFFLLIIILIFILLNLSNTITIENKFLSLKVNIGFLVMLSALFSSLATVFFRTSFSGKTNSKSLKKQIEDEKLKNEIESDKVKQLQEKIKTLEEALKMATKK